MRPSANSPCALHYKPPQAVDNLMPGFDREIARLAQRLLIQGRPIDYHTGVIASKVTPGVPGGCRGCARRWVLQPRHLRGGEGGATGKGCARVC